MPLYSHGHQGGCFRGDADVLVDRLIEVCQRQEACPVVHGRELQRWCPDAGDASMFGPLEEPHRSKHGRSPDSKKSTGSAAKRATPGSPVARRCSLDARQGFVCPSFGASAAPKPSALPIPSSSLLTRAFRSPSPPKAMRIAA